MFDVNGNLHIFDSFQVDRSLPKFQVIEEEDEDAEWGDSSMKMSSGTRIRARRGQLNFVMSDGNDLVLREGDPHGALLKPTWIQYILIRLLFLLSPEDKKLVVAPLQDPPRPVEITVQEFFSSLKNSTEELAMVDERARGYEAALERARKTGQTALVERLQAGITAVRAETQLIALGLQKVLSEETLVEFVKKSPKGLRLDWMKNFTRVVPDEVLATKVRCDERLIFDNYVVLHYDPDGKSWAETQEEAAARRDPILFGLLEGKRQLYFVGEWIDDYCDLTLDQIADTLGREATTNLDPEDFGAANE